MSIVGSNEIVLADQCSETDKRALAAYYGVGLRTIEKWLYRGIITGHKNGHNVVFNQAECDRRLLAHKPKSNHENN